MPEGAVLNYSPAEAPIASALPDDFEWADPTAMPSETSRHQASFEFDTVDFDAVPAPSGRRRSSTYDASSSEPQRPRSTDVAARSSASYEESLGSGGGYGAAGASSLDDDFLAEDQEPLDFGGPVETESRTGLLERFGRGSRGSGGKPPKAPKPAKRREPKGDEDVAGWLGVDESFDARKAGRKIGSWDNFDEESSSDEDFGWKGGWAGEDPIDDEDFASHEAARIRRRVTESVDRELSEKEVWFVATGAEEVGTYGMRAFLERYGDEVKDALIINIDNVGVGFAVLGDRRGHAAALLGGPAADRARQARVSRARDPGEAAGVPRPVDRRDARAGSRLQGDERDGVRRRRAAAQLALVHRHRRPRRREARGLGCRPRAST